MIWRAPLLLASVAALFVGTAAPPAMAQYFYEGLAAYRDGYFEVAFTIFRIEATQGNVEARYLMGRMYAKGEGVVQDHEDAALSFRQAAEQGHAKAQALLGFYYAKGEGVAKDLVAAYAWLSAAADQNLDEGREGKKIVVKVMSRSQIAKAEELSRDFRARYVLPFR